MFNVASSASWQHHAFAPNRISQLVLATLCSIMPRFIISVRELYDRDLRRRWQGIDTGFGVLSQPVSSGNAAVSAIHFADVAPGQEGQVAEGEVDDSEAIRLETWMSGDGMCQV